MNHFLAAQLVGLLAVFLSLAVYQFNNRKTMLLLSMLGAMSWSIHFYMLGANTGAATNLIAVGWSYVFLKVKPSRYNIWIPIVFLIGDIIAAYYTWQGYVSLFAVSGSMIYVIAFWFRSTKIIRRLSLISPFMWFVYNILSGSYPGMFFEIFTFTSNLIGQYRFDLKSNKSLSKTLI